MLEVARQTKEQEEQLEDRTALLQNLLARGGPSPSLTQEEFLVWTVEAGLAREFSQCVFQLCHVVLGLRPSGRREEGGVVRGWLAREERAGLAPGQVWYLLPMQWWTQWHGYVNWCQVLQTLQQYMLRIISISAGHRDHSRPGHPSLHAGARAKEERFAVGGIGQQRLQHRPGGGHRLHPAGGEREQQAGHPGGRGQPRPGEAERPARSPARHDRQLSPDSGLPPPRDHSIDRGGRETAGWRQASARPGLRTRAGAALEISLPAVRRLSGSAETG